MLTIEQQELKAQSFLPKPYFAKTISSWVTPLAWKHVLDGITEGSKPPFRTVKSSKRCYRIRLSNAGQYEIHDNQDKSTAKFQLEKSSLLSGRKLPPHQSTTYYDPTDPKFKPRYFKADYLSDVVGIRFDASAVLVNRIIVFDTGTVERPYAFDTEEEAKKGLELLQSTTRWARSLDELKQRARADLINECMIRASWRCDGSSQVVIYTDTPQAKTIAMIRAKDIEQRLSSNPVLYSSAPYDWYTGYRVPISFWSHDGTKRILFTKQEQDEHWAKQSLFELFNLGFEAGCEGFSQSIAKSISSKLARQVTLKDYLNYCEDHPDRISQQAIEFLVSVTDEDIKQKSDKGHTVFHLAIIKQDFALYKALSSQDQNWHDIDHDGNSSLHLLISQWSMIKINSKLNINELNSSVWNVRDKTGKTALHQIIRKFCMSSVELGWIFKIVEAAIHKGADPSIQDDEGNTLYHTALKCLGAEGMVSKERIQKTITQLFNGLTDVHTLNNAGETLLHLAKEKQYFDIVRQLLEKGADPNIISKHGSLALSLCEVVEWKQDYLIDLLLKGKSVNLDHLNAQGKTALHLAIENNNVALANRLIDLGASLNIRNSSGQTPLDLAIDKGSPDLVDKLLKANPDLTTQDNTGNTLFHRALRSSHSQLSLRQTEQLLNILFGNLPKEIINRPNKAGETLLHLAIQNKRYDIIHQLLIQGADPTVKDACGRCVLNLAEVIKWNRIDILKLLIDKINLNYSNFFDGALDAALDANKADLFYLLLVKGVNIASLKSNLLILDVVSKWQRRDINELLAKKIDIGNTDLQGNTELHKAAIRNDIQIIDILLSRGADLYRKNAAGHTPLSLLVTQDADILLLRQELFKSLSYFGFVRRMFCSLGRKLGFAAFVTGKYRYAWMSKHEVKTALIQNIKRLALNSLTPAGQEVVDSKYLDSLTVLRPLLLTSRDSMTDDQSFSAEKILPENTREKVLAVLEQFLMLPITDNQDVVLTDQEIAEKLHRLNIHIRDPRVFADDARERKLLFIFGTNNINTFRELHVLVNNTANKDYNQDLSKESKNFIQVIENYISSGHARSELALRRFQDSLDQIIKLNKPKFDTSLLPSELERLARQSLSSLQARLSLLEKRLLPQQFEEILTKLSKYEILDEKNLVKKDFITDEDITVPCSIGNGTIIYDYATLKKLLEEALPENPTNPLDRKSFTVEDIKFCAELEGVLSEAENLTPRGKPKL